LTDLSSPMNCGKHQIALRALERRPKSPLRRGDRDAAQQSPLSCGEAIVLERLKEREGAVESGPIHRLELMPNAGELVLTHRLGHPWGVGPWCTLGENQMMVTRWD